MKRSLLPIALIAVSVLLLLSSSIAAQNTAPTTTTLAPGGASSANQLTVIAKLTTMTTSLYDVLSNLSSLVAYSQPGTDYIFRSNSSNDDEKLEVKATPGVILGFSGRNAHATNHAYFRCANNTSGNVTPGTTLPTFEVMIPAAGVAYPSFGPGGVTFTSALTCWISTDKAYTAANDAAVDDVVANLIVR
jgi:hypothetical protein